MNIPNVDVMNQVTNVTNEPHSHVVVWMNETFSEFPLDCQADKRLKAVISFSACALL